MADSDQDPQPLSRRERQVAEAYADGLSYRELAERLGIAPTTVRTHLGTIYRKLAVSTKIELLHALRTQSDMVEAPPVHEAASQTAHAERRQATVLFAMPDGLAGIGPRDDPETVAALISEFQKIATAAIATHEGEKVGSRGAEVSACFGLPAADETDSERAVKCAIEIDQGVRTSAVLAKAPLQVRIGIYSGTVIFGTPSASIEELTGGASYMAAALAREAKGGGIVVCSQTQATLGGLFAFADLGPIEIDQGADALKSFAVSPAEPAATRFEALHGYRLSPFIGREHEIGLLEAMFHRVAEGEGQAALISGEAGIGKSRTVRTLCERLEIAQSNMLVFQCSPYEQSSPLHAVAGALRQEADVESHGSSAERIDALAKLFDDVIEDPTRDRDLLAGLALIPFEAPSDYVPVPSDKRQGLTFELLDRYLARRADPGPLLVVFEDLHWADLTLLQWLERTVERVETMPVLVLMTARPEFTPPPSVQSIVTNLALQRLDRKRTAELVAAQTGDRKLSDDLVQNIAERSEGIPLYVEELARAILELGQTAEAVPTTLTASLLGRLDRLGPAREVAQAASVIGRDFDADLLAEIVPHGPKALGKALDALIAARLVLRRGTDARAFQFKHALIRDAAYESLVRTRREALHEEVAATLLARRESGRDIADHLIAQHFVDGGAEARATPHWLQAARIAVRNGAENAASEFAQRGQECVGSVKDDRDRDYHQFEFYILRYMSEYSRGDVTQMLTYAREAQVCAERMEDDLSLSRALDAQAYLLASAGRVSEAVIAGEQCVAICDRLDLSIGEDLINDAFIGANMMLGRSYFAAGRYRDAIRQGEIVRDYIGTDVTRGDLNSPLNQYISARAWLCYMHSELGEFDLAEAYITEGREALPMASAREHTGLWIELSYSRMLTLAGRFDEAIHALMPKLDVCRSTYPVYVARAAIGMGRALSMRGDADKAVALFEEADRISSEKNFLFLWALLLGEFATTLTSLGDPTGAEKLANRGMEIAGKAGEQGNRAWSLFAAGEAALALGKQDTADALLSEALDVARKAGMRPLMERCISIRAVE